MKIYLASSWRNVFHSTYLAALDRAGHDVYDFRNPTLDNKGFHWSEIDPNWKRWDADTYRDALKHPIAKSGFKLDWDAMNWAQIGVLLLPCGRSAHLEAGYFVGAHKPLVITLEGENEPELMYNMADKVCIGVCETLDAIDALSLRDAFEATA